MTEKQWGEDGKCCSCGYTGEEETRCPKRDDEIHCVHWSQGPGSDEDYFTDRAALEADLREWADTWENYDLEKLALHLLERGWTRQGVNVEDVVEIVQKRCRFSLSSNMSPLSVLVGNDIIDDIRALAQGDVHKNPPVYESVNDAETVNGGSK